MTTARDDGDHLLLTGRWGSLAATPLGGTVTSWRPRGVPRLFTSRAARPALGEMWHGGVPLCTPWFGQAAGAGWRVPWSHGLASRVRWDVTGAEGDDEGARLTMTTTGAATAGLPGADRYPADLTYLLDVRADARRLELRLTIGSPTEDTAVDAVFHPYFSADATAEEVHGLDGVAFHDYADDSDGVQAGPVRAAGPINRVYVGAPPVRLARSGLRLDGDGCDTVVVWNPGPSSGQVPGDEWGSFACVEYGALGVAIPAGGTHEVTLRVTAS
ncbi:MAG: hypothetical protein QM713_05085 [Arachnia sp.]